MMRMPGCSHSRSPRAGHSREGRQKRPSLPRPMKTTHLRLIKVQSLLAHAERAEDMQRAIAYYAAVGRYHADWLCEKLQESLAREATLNRQLGISAGIHPEDVPHLMAEHPEVLYLYGYFMEALGSALGIGGDDLS
jgi:hypothetical protein